MKKLIAKDNDLFTKYMKRIMFECAVKDLKTISTPDAVNIIKELDIAVKIENEIVNILNSSNCSIDKIDYSNSLIDAITRMYEVFSIILIFQEGKYIKEYDDTKSYLSSIPDLLQYVNETIQKNGGKFTGIPNRDEK